MHMAHSRKHALKKSSSPSVCCAFGIWVGGKKEGSWVLFIVRVKCFFYVFVQKMWTLLHRGIIVHEKTPLGWFKGWSNETSFNHFMFLYELFGLWCVTLVAFFTGTFIWKKYIVQSRHNYSLIVHVFQELLSQSSIQDKKTKCHKLFINHVINVTINVLKALLNL